MEDPKVPLPITTLMLDVMAGIERYIEEDGSIQWSQVDEDLLPILEKIAELEHEITRQRTHDDVQIELRARQLRTRIGR